MPPFENAIIIPSYAGMQRKEEKDSKLEECPKKRPANEDDVFGRILTKHKRIKYLPT